MSVFACSKSLHTVPCWVLGGPTEVLPPNTLVKFWGLRLISPKEQHCLVGLHYTHNFSALQALILLGPLLLLLLWCHISVVMCELLFPFPLHPKSSFHRMQQVEESAKYLRQPLPLGCRRHSHEEIIRHDCAWHSGSAHEGSAVMGVTAVRIIVGELTMVCTDLLWKTWMVKYINP